MTEAELTGPALRTFFNIAAAWKLSRAEQMRILGQSSISTVTYWKSGKIKKISRDTLERISYVIGVFKAINTILPVTDRADEWMRRPNKAPPFGGMSAIERMAKGNVSDLYVVRQYLDAQLTSP
ncbi:DUF2384 domain-containing protein [Polymorphobacter arshaanensis]|uniref:DUF2384 domain-containing protein n=1 Tax=Glacieibacterium arshaanense TaxID=2511025 RepID=A0A4Y9ERE6_9SPHN|nr:antitoxin Xre-like helix-turn-helix domain-containing protein [Polymorphobacter arshaanensis]TFU06174.1 DUF2384 domain-containing protein [Polymorphobacter arshaanensis]